MCYRLNSPLDDAEVLAASECDVISIFADDQLKALDRPRSTITSCPWERRKFEEKEIHGGRMIRR